MGFVKDIFELRVGYSVRFMLNGLPVIEHPFSLFLLGADALCAGQKALSWNYKGMSLTANSRTGTLMGFAKLNRGSKFE